MYYYIVPLNERDGLKELRISHTPHTFTYNGPLSGVLYNGKSIEHARFLSYEDAMEAITDAAPEYLP